MKQTTTRQNHTSRSSNTREVENIHDLPQIFHYWAGRYLTPPLKELFGSADPVQIFTDTFTECASGRHPIFLRIGSGGCSIEVDVARRLKGTRFGSSVDSTWGVEAAWGSLAATISNLGYGLKRGAPLLSLYSEILGQYPIHMNCLFHEHGK